jgi:hypothetical protein
MKRALLLAALLFASELRAQTIEIPIGEQGQANLALPARGDSQRAVLERFDLADEEHPALGQPPSKRWDYRGFPVYFESGRVRNSVRQQQPHNPEE